MREVAVVDAGHREHAEEIERDGRPCRKRAETHPKDTEAAKVKYHKRHDAHPIDLVGLVAHFLRPIGAVIGIHPLDDGGLKAAEYRRTN